MKWLCLILACGLCLVSGFNLGSAYTKKQLRKQPAKYLVMYYGESGPRRGFNCEEITLAGPMQTKDHVIHLLWQIMHDTGSSNMAPVSIFPLAD